MTATDTDDFTRDWQTWHEAREAALREPHGWLSLTAFHWLDSEPAALEGLPGLWRSADGVAIVAAAAADGLTVDGPAVGGPDGPAPIDGTATFDPAEGAGPQWVGFGDKKIEIALRGGRHAVRVRDPKAPTRAAFTGVPTFAPDSAWVRTGRFTAYADPEAVIVGAARPDLKHTLHAVGAVRFDLDGRQQELLATAAGDGRLGLLFRDATNGDSTEAWRQLNTEPPGPDGTVTLDFNRSVNLPCTFTDYGTCPLPPGPNTIGAAVTAGERALG